MKRLYFNPVRSILLLLVAVTLFMGSRSQTAAAMPGPARAEAGLALAAGTPTPTPTANRPTSTVKVMIVAPSLPYRSGSLLKGSGPGVFYLNEDGARQHIYNWDTFRAFGFSPQEIIEIEDAVLESVPLAGELTRLVSHAGTLYWAAGGQLWRVNEWQDVVSSASYTGLLVTRLDSGLKARLPVRATFENGALLRQGQDVYYFEHGLVNARLIPVPAGAYDEAQVIDVPQEVLSVYEQKEYLDRVETHLRPGINAANLRQGPGLQFDVTGMAGRSESLRVVGRTAAGDWLQIDRADGNGWIAASLVATGPGLALLPVAPAEVTAQALPQAEPAALVETSPAPPQPLTCSEVPMRGFGQVWGDQPQIQAELGCPYNWDGGERGTNAAVQQFEHGLMVWLEADSSFSGDPVYVFFDDGTYQRFSDLGPADPAKVGAIPAGFYPVGDRFGKVYWEGTGARVKERLGYATGEATDSPGAFQEFQYGRMFWAGAVNRILVLLQYTGDYQPINRYYSFVDCFEVACEE